MAIFEKTYSPKSILDDTEKLICTVQNTQNVNKHTEYLLCVQRGICKENQWTVSRRYRDFAALHASLQQANIDLPLPPKKLIGNMQPSFIAERQIALQNYINEVLKHPVLALSFQVRSFLDPSNYSVTIAEQALQTMSIALRGAGHYELKGPLADVGWRIRKHVFLVTNTVSKQNCLLAWQNYGPDKYLEDEELHTVFKCLLNLSHPHIDQILDIQNLETGAYVVRRIHENGSVRDMLYGTEYNKSHLLKYGNPKVRKPFTTGQIAHYGSQILEALIFLHSKKLFHGHLHPGNIAIENQKALLLDIENSLLGVPCLYRPYLLEFRLMTPDAIDVYCFGRTLYEMALASPLFEFYCDNFPDTIPGDLESVLRLCLSSESCKHGAPSLEELQQHPFFSRPQLNGFSTHDLPANLKIPLKLWDKLVNAKADTELRLMKEQKMVRRARREVRIQEILNSDEEMKKQRRRARKRESVWKSTSSLAETVHSHSASTASSPTPPALSETSWNSSATSPAGGSRTALLDAICAFDKGRLARVTAQPTTA